jgi:hypothetical protein
LQDVQRGTHQVLRLVGVNAGHFQVAFGGTAAGALTYFIKSTVLLELLGRPVMIPAAAPTEQDGQLGTVAPE